MESKNETLEENDKNVDNISEDNSEQEDGIPDGNDNNEATINMIDDVIDDFNNNVMPEANENFGVLELGRSTRTRQDVKRLTFAQVGHFNEKHNVFHQSTSKSYEYTTYKAVVIGNMLDKIEYVLSTGVSTGETICGGEPISLGQQLILEKGLKIFGKAGYEAIIKEMGQMDDRVTFEQVRISKMSATERRKAQTALVYLTKKRDGTIKGHAVYNSKPT